MGQGLKTMLAQVTSAQLGVPAELIDVTSGDTGTIALGHGGFASRQTVTAGSSVHGAAKEVRSKIINMAAHLMEAAEEDIETGNGNLWVKGTDKSMTIRDLARALYSEMGREPKQMRDEIDNLEATKVYDPFFGTTTAATHMCLVEIDPETYGLSLIHISEPTRPY